MTTAAPAREVRFKVYPKQAAFLADERKFVAFIGGRGSGKTHSGSLKAINHATQGGLGLVAAPTFPMLRLGAQRQFLQRLRDMGVAYQHQKQEGLISIPEWGAEVQLASLETEGRIRGPNYRWGWFDELDYLSDAEMWRAAKGSVRDGPAPQLFATSTPKGRNRNVYPEWVGASPDTHSLYRASTLDNPFIDAARYVADLGYTGTYYQQEIEASFVGFEGLVYPSWSRDRVQVVDVTDWPVRLQGVDIGARNPTAVVALHIRGDGRPHVSREFYRGNLGATEILAAVGTELLEVAPSRALVDPSARAFITDLARLGYPAYRANNDVTYGIQAVQALLDAGLTVDPACVNLIDEFESYHYPDNGAKDSPVKELDHALDALRYAAAEARQPEPTVWVV